MKVSLSLLTLAVAPSVDSAALFQRQHSLSRTVGCEDGSCNSSRSDFPESVTREAARTRGDEEGRNVEKSNDDDAKPIINDKKRADSSDESISEDVSIRASCECRKDDPDCDCILDERKNNALQERPASKKTKMGERKQFSLSDVTATKFDSKQAHVETTRASKHSKNPADEQTQSDVAQQVDETDSSQDETEETKDEDDGDDCECINGRSSDPQCECPNAPDVGPKQQEDNEPCDCAKDDPDCDCILDGDKISDQIGDAEVVSLPNISSSAKEPQEDGPAVVRTKKQTASKLNENAVSLHAEKAIKRQPQMLNDGVAPTPAPAAPAPAVVPTTPPVMGSAGSVAQVAQPVTDPLLLKYNELLGRIERLRAEIKLWSDHAAWNQKILADKLAVEKETTPALADMLADIRYEMHQMTVPVFVEVLTDKLEILLAEERSMKEQIDARQGQAVAAGSGEWEKQSKAPTKNSINRIDLPTMLIIFAVGLVVIGVVYFVMRKPRN